MSGIESFHQGDVGQTGDVGGIGTGTTGNNQVSFSYAPLSQRPGPNQTTGSSIPAPGYPHSLQTNYSKSQTDKTASWLVQLRDTLSATFKFGWASDDPVQINWQQACKRLENLDQHEKQFIEKGAEYHAAVSDIQTYIESNGLDFSPEMYELMVSIALAMRSIHHAIPFGGGNVLVRQDIDGPAENEPREKFVDVEATMAKDGLNSLAQEIRTAIPKNKSMAVDAEPANRVSAKSGACSIVTGCGTCGNYARLGALMIGDILFQNKDKFAEPAKLELRYNVEIDGKVIDHVILIVTVIDAATGKKHKLVIDSWKLGIPVRLEDTRYKNGDTFYQLSCDKPVKYKKWIGQYMNEARKFVGEVIESDQYKSDVEKAATEISDADPTKTYKLTDTFHGFVDRDGIDTLNEGVVVPRSRRVSLLPAKSSPLYALITKSSP